MVQRVQTNNNQQPQQPQPQQTTTNNKQQHQEQHNTTMDWPKMDWPKIGLAKVGHNPARVAHPEAVPKNNAELVALCKERDTLQASLQAFQTDNNARRKQARTLATPSDDLVPVNSAVASSSASTAMDLALPQRQDRSSTMESLIQRGAEQFQSANRVHGTDCEVSVSVKRATQGQWQRR